ncbi:unnamed protein product [Diamesa hyperborea]
MYNNNNNNYNHPGGNSNDYNHAQSYNKNYPQYNNSSTYPKQPNLHPANTQQFQGNNNFQNNQNFHKHQQTYQHPYAPQKSFHQNYFQQPRMWNKRSHSTEAQTNYSPEPKRQQESEQSSPQSSKTSESPQSSQSPQSSKSSKNPQNSQNKTNQNSKQLPKPPTYNPAKIANDKKHLQWTTLFKSTLNKLENAPDHEVVNILRKNLQPTRAAWSRVKDQIIRDMMHMLSPLNVSKIVVFGSTLTGLDFYGSDSDYYVELIQQPQEDELVLILQEVSKLSRKNHDFWTIYRIEKARVPIVRLFHYLSGTFCDVNFSSKFGYYNSYFIGHVLNYDPRIKELAIILKLWSKSYKIAERSIMSNYCLIMIMIFFLQNLEFPMLQTIVENQSKISKMVLDTKTNWNFNFNDDINLSKNNTQTTRELLVDFFEFFNKINHENYILSIYTGELILTTEFNTHKSLAGYRQLIETQNIPPIIHDDANRFNIQDGFELNLNIGIRIKKHVDEFFDLIKLSHELCVEMKDKPLSEMLVKLFSDIFVPKRISNKEANREPTKRVSKCFILKIHSNEGELKICQDILAIKEKNNKDKIINVEACQLFYAQHVMESTKLFLEEIYCADVEEIESDGDFKRVYKVSLLVDTVNSRKKINFTNNNTFALEQLVSKQKVEKNDPFALDITMTLQSLDEGKTVDCNMVDNADVKKTSLSMFGSYFVVNIVNAIRFYLKKKFDELC